jgi:hypothetical protein
MTELTTSPDQISQSSIPERPDFAGDYIVAPLPATPEIPPTLAAGSDSPEIAQAVADAYQASQPATERFVFVDRRDQQGRTFEIAHATGQNPQAAEANPPMHDAYQETVRERQAAAAEQLEARATERQLTEAIGWNGQAVLTAREFAQRYGLEA